MLILMFALMIEWAIRNQTETADAEEQAKLEELFSGRIDVYTRWIRVLVNIQLFSMSLLQVPFIRIRLDLWPRLAEGLQSIGIESNPDAPTY